MFLFFRVLKDLQLFNAATLVNISQYFCNPSVTVDNIRINLTDILLVEDADEPAIYGFVKLGYVPLESEGYCLKHSPKHCCFIFPQTFERGVVIQFTKFTSNCGNKSCWIFLLPSQK